MAKFKCITDEGLDYAKANSEILLSKIKESPNNNAWLESDFFSKYKFKNTNYDINIKFKFDFDNPYKYDFENAVSLYELVDSLNLGKSFIYNEKFLTSFALQNAYSYLASFAGIKSLNGTIFFIGGKRRSIARNLIARLYLLVCLSTDIDKKDKYFYTKYVLNHPGLRRLVFYTYIDNKNAHSAFIKCIFDFESKNKKKLSTSQVHKALTHLSCLSNVSDVSTMEYNDLYNYLMDYIKEIVN